MKGDTARQVSKILKNNLLTRILSALVMIPLVLAATYFGYPYFNVLVGIVAVLMAWEWRRMVTGGRFGRLGLLFSAGILGAVFLASFGNFINGILVLGLISALFFIITAFKRLFIGADMHSEQTEKVVRPASALWMALGALYIGVPSVALIWIRNDWDNGFLAVVWLLVLVWAADSGAYAAGRLIGGAKLAPRISPNKTWAGLGGCIVSAGIVGFVVGEAMGMENPYGFVMVSSVIGAVSQGGDLLESGIKRHFGVKDSSNLIPGHGGILDRVDALLAVIVAAAVVNLMNKGALMS